MNMTRKPRKQRRASYLSVGEVGDGQDSDEAASRVSTLFSAKKKKPQPNPLRMGDTAGWTGALSFSEGYCAMVFTDTPRSIGVERP